MRRLARTALRTALMLAAAAGLMLAAAWGVELLRGTQVLRPPGQEPPAGAGAVPGVICSVHAVSELVRMVGGEDIAVTTLLPAGADPHTFELKPSQAALLRDASLVVAVGGGLDRFVDGLAGATGAGGKVVHLLDALPRADLLYADGGDTPDPHIWLDPALARERILPAVAAALARIDPAREVAYANRFAAASAELQALDEWVSGQAALLREKALITMHPAWAYFGRRYGVETYSVLAGHGSEPTPRHLEELLGIAVQRGIRVLFRERQVPGSSLDILIRGAGGQVMVLDPLGGPGLPGYDTYPALIRSNVETIVRGLTLP